MLQPILISLYAILQLLSLLANHHNSVRVSKSIAETYGGMPLRFLDTAWSYERRVFSRYDKEWKKRRIAMGWEKKEELPILPAHIQGPYR